MVRLARLCRSKYSPNDTTGSTIAPGRWNSNSTPCLYTASSLALALLETLVHIPWGGFPESYVYSTVGVDEPMIDPTEMPALYVSDEHGARSFGTEWLRSQSYLVLRVPSVIIPVEHNYVINAHHPAFGSLTFSDPAPFYFDRRLLRPVAGGGPARFA